MDKIRIGILGFGTIGSGVKAVIDEQNKYNIEIVKVFDRIEVKDKVGKPFTSDYNDVINNKDIDIVIETMGGLDFPYQLIKKALLNKKSVVTANKEVVAKYMKELMKIAKDNGVKFLFEASSGGGIPIISPLLENQKANEIDAIMGILNGTTNFIISRMEEGLEFNDALKLAQEKGFAEKDPTNDLEGLDMLRKIAILSDIGYDTFIDIDKIYHFGIRNLTKKFLDFAKKDGYSVKFLAKSIKHGNSIDISVEPVLIGNNSIIASVKDEYNIVIVNGKTNGKLMFIGKGAGKLPTASAIVNDIIKIKEDTFRFNLELDKVYSIYNIEKNNKYLIIDQDNNIKYSENKDDALFYAKVLEV